MVIANVTYNMTQLASVETLADLVTFANDASGGYLVSLFCISIYFIVFFSLLRWKAKAANLVASYITFIVSAMFWYIDKVAWLIPTVSLVMAVISTILLFVLKDKD